MVEQIDNAIRLFCTQTMDKIQAIYFEPKYMDEIAEEHNEIAQYYWMAYPCKPIPNDRKNMKIRGYPAYLRELNYRGLVIYGKIFKMFYYADNDRELFTRL